jgi:hypothetical protein
MVTVEEDLEVSSVPPVDNTVMPTEAEHV